MVTEVSSQESVGFAWRQVKIRMGSNNTGAGFWLGNFGWWVVGLSTGTGFGHSSWLGIWLLLCWMNFLQNLGGISAMRDEEELQETRWFVSYFVWHILF